MYLYIIYSIGPKLGVTHVLGPLGKTTRTGGSTEHIPSTFWLAMSVRAEWKTTVENFMRLALGLALNLP